MAALRKVGVGADDFVYVERFLNIPRISEWIYGHFIYSYAETQMEPGYTIVSSLVRELSDNYVLLFFVVALLSTGITLLFYYRYSSNPLLSALLFFSHQFLYKDINQIRSAIASAIVIWCIPLLCEKRYVKCFLLIILSAMFHIAALIIIIPLIFVIIVKAEKYRFFLAVFLAISFFAGYMEISKKIISIVPDLGFVADKIQNYSNSDEINSTSLFDLTNIKNVFISTLLLLLWRRLNNKNPIYKFMILFFLLGTMWRLAFSDLGIFAGRIATFLTVSEPLVVVCMLTILRQRFLGGCLVATYGFLTLYMNIYLKDGRHAYELFFQ